jgi:3'-phosphoadenosine 5'-phosphosulfate sulfotransferase (PAPS reductase)/FAD synthetase
MNMKPNIDDELSIISNAVKHYNLDSVFCLFSGGTDSLAATYVASHHPLFKGVIHLDTGIGIPDVQEYVIQVCKSQGWELKIYKAMEYRKRNGELAPQNYDDLVRRYGFPGPVNHKVMYSRLKEYPLQQANREIKSIFKSPAFVTGIRIAESARRAKNYASNFSGGGLRQAQF